ncbi:lipase [Fragilaria crotonensis]|nr:lipase [Fragilaria crotonensis]
MKILFFVHIALVARPIDSFSPQTGLALRVATNRSPRASTSSGDTDTMETNNKDENIDFSKGKKPQSYIKSRVKSLLASIRSVPVIPSGLSLLVGFQLGRKVAQSTATATTTATSRTIAAQARQWPLVSILVLSFGMRELWLATPTWIKRSILSHGRSSMQQLQLDDSTTTTTTAAATGAASTMNDDLTSLAAVATKLQSLSVLASDKLKIAQEERSDLQIAFLVLLQLVAQIKAQSAEVRDASYQLDGTPIIVGDDEDSGPVNDASLKLVQGLDEIFEFADWAYDELPNEQSLEEALANVGFSLLRHDKTELPGYVSHYVAISKERKTALIGVKGTSNLGDMLTDCCGLAVSYELTGPYVRGGNTTIRCHEGVVISAQRLFAKLELLVEELLFPSGYTILVTGHSLGAGVAALVGILLRSRFPTLLDDERGTVLRVVAFASPPVLDCDSALSCEPFVTTIVNNADIIPRASLSNLVVLMEFLKVLDDKLENAGLKPKDLVGVSQFILNLTKTNSEMVMSLDEIMQGLNQAFDKVDLRDPDHLYVPGKVIHMYDMWSKENYGKVEDSSVADETEPNSIKAVRTAERAQWTDGTSRALRTIELDSRFLSDHLSPSYRSSIRCLLDLMGTKSIQNSS